jgi:hypothetical protein
MWFLIIMMSSTGLLNSAEQVALYGPYPSKHACDLAGELFDASGYTPTGARIAGCVRFFKVGLEPISASAGVT